MSRFGWAYVNCDEDPGHANIDGVTGSVMFLTGNNSMSGSNHLMYNYNGSVPGVDGTPQSSLILTGTLYVKGAVSASHFHYEDITRIDASGSTRFGNTADDYHQRTGSLYVGAPDDTLLEINVNASQSINFGSMRYSYKSVSGAVSAITYASAAIGDYIVGVKGQCPVEIRLPSASSSFAVLNAVPRYPMTGNVLVIKDEYTGDREIIHDVPAAICLSGTDGETVDGEPYYQMTGTMTAISLYSNGSNWFVF